MSDAAACCLAICLSIIVLPITLISLTLKTHNPKVSVEDLYIPAINVAAPSNATHLNTFVFIDLRLRNSMPLTGLRYEALNLSLFYGGDRSLAVAEGAVAGFYQGMKKTARKTAVLRTRGLPWEDAFDRISRGLTVDIAVEVAMAVKLRRWGVYRKRKVVVVAGVVSLDGSGEEVDEKVVRLN
ncbi:protein NDR1-like [Salvia divinorum]|uniref:Protein NDR1-like n=1 Tax=Salvia divinorum TaxID=28513 RepID=A0ABD1HH74_SALDI